MEQSTSQQQARWLADLIRVRKSLAALTACEIDATRKQRLGDATLLLWSIIIEMETGEDLLVIEGMDDGPQAKE